MHSPSSRTRPLVLLLAAVLLLGGGAVALGTGDPRALLALGLAAAGGGCGALALAGRAPRRPPAGARRGGHRPDRTLPAAAGWGTDARVSERRRAGPDGSSAGRRDSPAPGAVRAGVPVVLHARWGGAGRRPAPGGDASPGPGRAPALGHGRAAALDPRRDRAPGGGRAAAPPPPEARAPLAAALAREALVARASGPVPLIEEDQRSQPARGGA